ncbi:hypothetical protein [Photobacterium sp. 1_MG-2023]|uniref:hypothetical protein n=1 Tax=Photobacterium sp. 1_MG-2023 TaxID=3062646 RepID=UPI0026E1FBD9|nr:hypothetical protein [Photobacterium sp. 1_MG-2023]MDO6707441.1 hypothetical protein [Photobacterium sp. 1_MG-2023]
MRHGWGMWIGLWMLLLAWPLRADELSQQEFQQVTSDVVPALNSLKSLYRDSEIDQLNRQLADFPVLAQEALRAGLVEYAQTLDQLDETKVTWLETLVTRKPRFTLTEQGDGYRVTRSAFNYGPQARQLLQHWQREQLAAAFVRQADAGELVLSDWLAGERNVQRVRRDIALAQLPAVSEQGQRYLANQFLSDKQLLWLPNNGLLAQLAESTGDEALYQQLWRRRTDQYSRAELNRLTDLLPDQLAVNQLIEATRNPSLKAQAYQALATLKPLPAQVEVFLLAKLSEPEDGEMVAGHLVSEGHSSWLMKLAAGTKSYTLKRNLETALSSSL